MIQIVDPKYPNYTIYKYDYNEGRKRISELSKLKNLTPEQDGELSGLSMAIGTKNMVRLPLLKVAYIVERGNYERENSKLN